MAAIALAAVLAGAGAEPEHAIGREPESSGPTTASQTSARLNLFAEELRSNGQNAPRVGIFDVAWPSSSAEFEAVGRNGILQVTVVVADHNELPIRRTYIHTTTGDVPLLLLDTVDSVEPDGAPIRSVGAFRADSYYLLPVGLARGSGSILIDFAQHRSGFELSSLPLGPPSYSESTTGARPPERQAVIEFLNREFPEAPTPTRKP